METVICIATVVAVVLYFVANRMLNHKIKEIKKRLE